MNRLLIVAARNVGTSLSEKSYYYSAAIIDWKVDGTAPIGSTMGVSNDQWDVYEADADPLNIIYPDPIADGPNAMTPGGTIEIVVGPVVDSAKPFQKVP